MAVSFKCIFMTILVMLTYACDNAPPVADAGPDQVTVTYSIVTLNGSNSSDASGSNLSFNWSLVTVPFGSMATLSDPTAETPTFSPDIGGIYRASLSVANGSANSAADSVTIVASQRPVNNLENVVSSSSDLDEAQVEELSYCD